ncbi:cytochrome domain of cellobiose dehydrogenase domain-containing protein [Sarocladium implicatum]|nr:cytochrome domain of cellobiose dehydrogenase domain-containing protein [Sarocladium implicatum]
MLLRNLALAAAAVFAPARAKDDDQGQSVFVTDDKALAFAFTVPSENNVDLAFSLRVKRSYSWGAIGLGSDDMPGALYFIIYENADRDNVTLSPRVTYKNVEPYYFDEPEFEVLPGTGVDDDYMTYTARCKSHCRSWPAHGGAGGTIDVSHSDQKVIYALGPKEGFASDKLDQALKMHSRYGRFSLNMKRTRDVNEDPVIKDDTVTDGATAEFSKSGVSDAKSTAHAVLMTLGIVALMPLGALMLRLGGWVRAHALNQTVAMIFVLAGFGLGVATSFNYQRSLSFKSYHQIIGIVVVAFIIAQFTIGFLHHKKFKDTQNPTIYGKIHVWLGRIILFFGIMNAFFGLTFALNRRYGMILAALLIFVLFVLFAVTFGRRWFTNQRRAPLDAGHQPYGHSQPWRQPPPPGAAGAGMYGGEAPPGYEPPSQQDRIGLRPVSPGPPSPWRSNAERKDDDDMPNLGSAQTPREFT